MTMKAKAIVRVKFASKKDLDIVLKALQPEAKRSITMRSKTSLKENGKFLVLKVEARDTTALRAALNAYLRWINSTAAVLRVLEKFF